MPVLHEQKSIGHPFHQLLSVLQLTKEEWDQLSVCVIKTGAIFMSFPLIITQVTQCYSISSSKKEEKMRHNLSPNTGEKTNFYLSTLSGSLCSN